MSDIKIENDLLSFPKLARLGVKNFVTYNNEFWDAMSLRSEEVIEKYLKAFAFSDINANEVLYMGAEQNDNVQFITKANLNIYRLFSKHEKSNEHLNILVVSGDCVITKEQIPILLTPADCAAICLTAIDKKDSKRFIIFIHSGVYGTMLNVHKKALKLAHAEYSFDNSELETFIFPAISGENYVKSKDDSSRGYLANDPEWKDFIIDKGSEFGMNFKEKIIHDLKHLGIKNITDSGIDAYKANAEGKLFSLTYAKKNDIKDYKNFVIGVSL